MKRSEINRIMQDAADFIKSYHYILPPFAFWSPENWKTKGIEAEEIVKTAMGWDITDFGKGDFEKTGLFLFTVRNGYVKDLSKGKGKLYAEKIMVVNPGQVTPMHFHWNKTEDIINRGGGILVIELHNATEEGELATTEVSVSMDGVRRVLPAGARIELQPGESITLEPYHYHSFWGEEERVLVGEVSTVNDDHKDNRFLEEIGRFPEIEEDEEPLHLLVNDYKKYFLKED